MVELKVSLIMEKVMGDFLNNDDWDYIKGAIEFYLEAGESNSSSSYSDMMAALQDIGKKIVETYCIENCIDEPNIQKPNS